MPTVPELKAMAKARGIKGFSKMLKGELEAALAAAAPARPAAAPMAPGLEAAMAAAAALPGHGAYEEAYAPVARPAAAAAAASSIPDWIRALDPGDPVSFGTRFQIGQRTTDGGYILKTAKNGSIVVGEHGNRRLPKRLTFEVVGDDLVRREAGRGAADELLISSVLFKPLSEVKEIVARSTYRREGHGLINLRNYVASGDEMLRERYAAAKAAEAAAPARPAAAPARPAAAPARPAAAPARPAAAPKKDDRPFAKAPGVASAIDKLRAVEAATQRRNTMRQVEALDKEITRLTALKGELEAALARPAAAAAAAAAASARAREDARYADADARRLAKEREIKALADSGAPVGTIKDKIVAEYVPLWKESAPVLEMGDMLDDFLDEVAARRGVSPMFLGTFRKSVRDRITY